MKDLKLAWVYQMTVTHRVESTPLVVDDVMYISEPPSNVVALDAATGRPFWRYKRSLPTKVNVCCGQVNRGARSLVIAFSSVQWTHTSWRSMRKREAFCGVSRSNLDRSQHS